MNKLIDNPPDGYCFETSYPYRPGKAVVRNIKTGNKWRRCVNYSDPHTGRYHGTAYARMYYAIQLWNTTQTYITPGYEVDHINNDPMDDRFDNYQELTNSQNSAKSAAIKGLKQVVLLCPICIHLGQNPYFMRGPTDTQYNPARLDRVCFCGDHHRDVFRNIKGSMFDQELMKFLTVNQILYHGRLFRDTPWSLARFEIEHFGSRAMLDPSWELRVNGEIPLIEGVRYLTLDEKLKVIKEGYVNNKTNGMLAEELNMRHSQIAKLVARYMPEENKQNRTLRRLEIIKQRLSKNIPVRDIAKEIHVDERLVNQLIKERLDIHRRNGRHNHEENLAKIKAEYDKGLNCVEIARNTNLPLRMIKIYTKKYFGRGFRETKAGVEVTSLIEKIKKLSSEGLKVKQIVKILNEPYARIYGLYWDHVRNPGYNTKNSLRMQ